MALAFLHVSDSFDRLLEGEENPATSNDSEGHASKRQIPSLERRDAICLTEVREHGQHVDQRRPHCKQACSEVTAVKRSIDRRFFRRLP